MTRLIVAALLVSPVAAAVNYSSEVDELRIKCVKERGLASGEGIPSCDRLAEMESKPYTLGDKEKQEKPVNNAESDEWNGAPASSNRSGKHRGRENHGGKKPGAAERRSDASPGRK
ncbi:MAG: hypothetical protein LBE33_03230 [Zoogloeaceae bacterium]|jgi:hypothetical protein|nr:hypothetical protein [Zoogloeaceae bacterium]